MVWLINTSKLNKDKSNCIKDAASYVISSIEQMSLLHYNEEGCAIYRATIPLISNDEGNKQCTNDLLEVVEILRESTAALYKDTHAENTCLKNGLTFSANDSAVIVEFKAEEKYSLASLLRGIAENIKHYNPNENNNNLLFESMLSTLRMFDLSQFTTSQISILNEKTLNDNVSATISNDKVVEPDKEKLRAI